MASKSKGKLKRKQFKVEDKIIDLERFAYDVFVYSAKKFGVPEECICRWKGVENDYGHPDFLLVLSRSLFRCQITQRCGLYKRFKSFYDPIKFKSFDKIKSSLQQVLYDTASFPGNVIMYEFLISLAVISELVIFLYTENCGLHLTDLAKFWFEYWFSRKKALEKAGGPADLYDKFSTLEEVNVDIFFNEFIPAHCIPYHESSTLNDIYNKKYSKFFNVTELNLEKLRKQVHEKLSSGNRDITEHFSQCSLKGESSEEDEASETYKLRNTGLGITTPEDLLRAVLGKKPVTPPKDIPSTSRPRRTRSRRESYRQKERPRMKTSSRSSVGDVEQLNIGVLGAHASTSPPNLPSTIRQGTEDDSRRFSSKKLEIKETSSFSPMGFLDGLDASFFGTHASASPEDLPSTSRTRRMRDRRESYRQKERQRMKTSSRSSVGDVEQLNIDFLGAHASTSPTNLPSTIRQGTEDDRKFSSKKLEIKETSSFSPMGFLDGLNISFFEDILPSSPEDLTSTILQETLGDSRSFSIQNIEITETSSFCPMGYFDGLDPSFFETHASTSPPNLRSIIRQGTERDRRSSSQKERQKKNVTFNL